MTGKTILIVEDEAIIAVQLQSILDALGYTALAPVASGEAALAAVRAQPPDLILMDISLHGAMDGITAAGHIQAAADIPIVYLTGYSQDLQLQQAKVTAPYGYLVKPVGERELAATLEMALFKHPLDRRLRESEERYRRLVDNASEAILVVQDSRLEFVNRRAFELSGHTEQELTARPFAEFIHPDDREMVAERYLRRLKSEASLQRAAFRLMTRDGSVMWVEVGAVSMDWEGRPAKLMFLSDITKRKQAEELLRETEQLWRSYIDNAPSGVFVADETGRYVQVNPAACRQTGYSEAELLARGIPDMLPADSLEYGMAGFAALPSAGHVYVESPFLTKAGERRWWSVNAVKLSEHRFLGFTDDITERVQAEAQREQLLARIDGQARRVGEILFTVPAGVVLLDAVGRALQANPTAERDLAMLANAKVGDLITHLGNRPLPELLSPPPEGLWHQVEAGERIFEVIARPVEPDVSAPGSGSVSPTIADGAGLEHWVLVINDVTREREVLAELQQQERLAAVGQLAAGIAHDFNNILAVFALYGHMVMQTQELSERNRERMGTIIQQAELASRLIQQILDFSRRSVLARKPCNLLTLLREQVALLERTLPEDISIELNYQGEEDDYTVHADPTRLQQTITNLALNARDAMPSGGTLRFSIERLTVPSDQSPSIVGPGPGEWIKLSAADTGTGIAPDVLSRIFEPFFTTKAPGSNSGLGLSQVHGIVGLHGGRISVESQVGAGTTFTIHLPALDVRPVALVAPYDHATPEGRGKVILVVEDNTVLRGALVDILEMLDYRSLAAGNGEQALATLEHQEAQIALVLSDVVMPGMGGVAMLQTMRERGWRTPVILLSGHPMSVEFEGLWALGLSAWLTKPPSIEGLAQAIDEALREA